MIAVTFGIPGVGKSSIVKEVIKQLPIERIHWGSHAFHLAEKSGIVNNVDKLRKQDLRIQKPLQLETAQEIKELMDKSASEHFIIETHAALKTPQGYLPGLHPEILNMFSPDVFIVYEAEAGHIYHRRMVDPERDRSDDQSVRGVQLNLDITRYFASAIAVQAGGTLFVIENKEGELDFAVGATVEALAKFIS